MSNFKFIKRFDELGIDDVPLVGGKNASLGEMYRELSDQGVKVPNGYATTADGYRHYINSNNLQEKIVAELQALDSANVDRLAEAGEKIRRWVGEAEMPRDLQDEIVAAYRELCKSEGREIDVAVRSSATAEDLPDASFAGQQETYLNICGEEQLLRTCKRVFASLFTNRAISYRVDKGFTHVDVALSIGVQKMVRSDKGAAGVIFTLDTESGFRDVVFITGAYGLGENVVQGAVDPDEFYVFKPTLASGHRPIIKRRLGSKKIKMVYGDDASAGLSTLNVDVSLGAQNAFCIDDDDVLTLAKYAVTIEQHYTRKAGTDRPMDIEWAKDGVTGELFIVQARPETVQSQRTGLIQEVYTLNETAEVIAEGKAVGEKIATGKARVILSAEQINEVKPGDILVTDMTDPDWEPIMKIASGIVTNRGGRICHAAIIARELGIPAVVGCGDATVAIAENEMVTLSCAEGDIGRIYQGELAFNKAEMDLSGLGKPQTKIMLNLANPDIAFKVSQLPNDGVGLARLEFIINNSIGVHPHALLDYHKLDRDLRKKIHDKMAGYDSPSDFYVRRLSEGVGTIASAVYPKPIIVRMSDFKSNEYRSLIGGSLYEPTEDNPMIGFRGAYRYPTKAFHDSFALECVAIKKVREEMGLDNVNIMIPFVRTLHEQEEVLRLLEEEGLKRGEHGLQVMIMCEIPANALLADQFLERCDGFSIGSNDLTQLTLGMDRDAGMQGGDERNEAVLKMMEMAIIACKKAGKYIGICGQAPSDFPEITQWLVEQGIESMSLNPDSVLRMTQVVLDTEENRASQ
ncbi:MAG: phosphoenolpyruvate synthase [Gammaproteobacteria bacterium]|nr:phosphoenolpyruvate synthase [Gammaproteobacteria bacterium]NNM10287.1 phosphoenolpyruvate synthase [Pseudomonadales bacterium]